MIEWLLNDYVRGPEIFNVEIRDMSQILTDYPVNT